jgi:hypothetical protein
VLCSKQAPRAIVSDNRQGASALRLLRCVGTAPTDEFNWDSIIGQGDIITGTFKLVEPPHAVGPFSFALKPLDNASAVQAVTPQGSPAILARGDAGEDQSFFITTLTQAASRVLPFTWISNYYTGESLHPTFHIPEMYWPEGGYDRIKAFVQVTRPLRGLGDVASQAGAAEPRRIEGDTLDPLHSALLGLDPNQTGELIPTETLEFELFDDGTNGDGTANDHYWEVSLPAEVAEFDGQYRFHAIFELCNGASCVRREAEQTTIVETKVSPEKTEISKERLESIGGRNRTRILVTPVDAAGHRLGPGLAASLLVSSLCDVQVEAIGDADGKGTYQIIVNWTEIQGQPRLVIGQFGRPKERIEIALP